MELEIKRMLSAYLDGELTQADRQRVRLHLETSEECRRELKELEAVKHLTAQLEFRNPPDVMMDALEARVSVQAPRRFGWSVLVIALCSWVVYAVVLAIRNLRWPSIPELLGGGVVAGLVLVFLSVLRQRVLERPHDRYRKVRR
jgi:anti-sigma factor RsiW